MPWNTNISPKIFIFFEKRVFQGLRNLKLFSKFWQYFWKKHQKLFKLPFFFLRSTLDLFQTKNVFLTSPYLNELTLPMYSRTRALTCYIFCTFSILYVDLTGEEYDQVTLRRKGYVQKIASKVITRQQSVVTPLPSDYKHLFECLLLIGLDLDTRNNKVPYIKMKYPRNVSHILRPSNLHSPLNPVVAVRKSSA